MRKRFGKVAAVDGISLTVHPREMVGLVGPNGAGKTTALRCLSGLLRMDTGRVRLGGHDIIDDPIPARQSLAFIPEVPQPFPALTPFEHLIFVARAYGLTEGWKSRAEVLLRNLDLDEKRESLAVELSKGQKQKIHLAMAMLRDPGVLVLDEPLIGIDPKGAHVLKAWIRERAEAGAGGIVSSHSLALIEAGGRRGASVGHRRVFGPRAVHQLPPPAAAARRTTFGEGVPKRNDGGGD